MTELSKRPNQLLRIFYFTASSGRTLRHMANKMVAGPKYLEPTRNYFHRKKREWDVAGWTTPAAALQKKSEPFNSFTD